MTRRPWVIPAEVRAYTDYPSVQARTEAKLTVDISRAEQYVINHTNNRFDDTAKYPEIPESVKMAVILIAEVYAFNAAEGAEGKGKIKSETFDDYSYTLADATANLADIDLGSLLDEFVIAEAKNGVTMRLRKL